MNRAIVTYEEWAASGAVSVNATTEEKLMAAYYAGVNEGMLRIDETVKKVTQRPSGKSE